MSLGRPLLLVAWLGQREWTLTLRCVRSCVFCDPRIKEHFTHNLSTHTQVKTKMAKGRTKTARPSRARASAVKIVAKTVGRRRREDPPRETQPQPQPEDRPPWCTAHCSRCAHEVNPLKQHCCGASVAGGCLSQVHLAQITALINLHDDDIDALPHVWTTTYAPASIAACTNAKKRLLAYGKLFRLLHGTGLPGVQVPLPSCCRVPISTAFP